VGELRDRIETRSGGVERRPSVRVDDRLTRRSLQETTAGGQAVNGKARRFAGSHRHTVRRDERGVPCLRSRQALHYLSYSPHRDPLHRAPAPLPQSYEIQAMPKPGIVQARHVLTWLPSKVPVPYPPSHHIKHFQRPRGTALQLVLNSHNACCRIWPHAAQSKRQPAPTAYFQ
jgi:hypothetical protein